MKLACILYNAGYAAGHHDTVEGTFTDVHHSEVDSYHATEVKELLEWFQSQAVPPSATEPITSAEEK